MGAFHDGHLSLVHRAKQECDRVVVSLFVNPTQFGKNEDLSKYPRNLERDAALAEQAGADTLFVPSVDEIYRGKGTIVHVNELSDVWEGAARPGHFNGVATVVNILFNMVQADRCYFGLKDLQQCMVLRRMVEDLNMREKLVFCPTVREEDGLAMSSRNVYLTAEMRSVAPAIHRELNTCRDAINRDESNSIAYLESAKTALTEAGFLVDYFAWVNLPDMDSAQQLGGEQALIVAAKLGTTRLIDNLIL